MDDVARGVYFLGGEERFPSVRIRSAQIAQALGCARGTHPSREHAVAVVTKYRGDLRALKSRVVWDVIDAPPPTDHVDAYLFSTRAARDHWRPMLPDRPLYVIPHHHCNVERVPPPPTDPDAVYFVGGEHWKPELPGISFTAIDTTSITVTALREVYARAHVLLNLRVANAAAEHHAKLASGIKLINALGFGVPSVSAREPAFEELAPDCTLFADHATAAAAVHRLQTDAPLHADLRARCLARAELFHLDTIAQRYREMLDEVLATA